MGESERVRVCERVSVGERGCGREREGVWEKRVNVGGRVWEKSECGERE